MIAQKLTLENFRGLNRTFTLGRVNIVTGENFAGKSSVPLALRLACVGSLPPPIGSTGIWPALAGNPGQPGRMSVWVRMDDGMTWNLAWERNAKGTVSKLGSPPDAVALPPVLCDPGTFWSLTGAEQTRAVFAACPGAKVTRKQVEECLTGVEASPAAIRAKFIETCMDGIAERFHANPPEQVGNSTVELLLADWKEHAKQIRPGLKRLEASVASGMWKGTVPRDRTKDLTAARQTLATLNAQQSAAQNIRTKSDAQKRERANAEQKLAVLDQRIEAFRAMQTVPDKTEEDAAKLDALIGASDEATEAVDGIERQLVRLRGMRADIASGKCPTCGCSGDALKRIDEETANTIRSLEAALVMARAVQQERENERAAESAKWAEHHAALAKWTVAARQAGADVAEAVRWRDYLANTTAVEPDLEWTAEQDKARDDARQRVEELEGEQGQFAAYVTQRGRQEQAEQDLIRMRCELDIVTGAAKSLTELLDRVAGEAFGSVLKAAGQLTDGLLESPLQFVGGELGRASSEADRERTGGKLPVGSWIPHTSFSGTEALIGYVGFALAIASKAPFRLVVMDELNRLTPDRKKALMVRITELVEAGVIDQFVGCDPNTEAWTKGELAGINVIEV